MGISDFFLFKGAPETEGDARENDQTHNMSFEGFVDPTGAVGPNVQFIVGENNANFEGEIPMLPAAAMMAAGNDFKDPQFIVVNYLLDICQGNGWFKLVDPLEPCVIKMNSRKGKEAKYRYLPACDYIAPFSFVDCAARFLRSDVCVRVSFPVIHAILDVFSDKKTVTLDADHNIQIIENIPDLQWVRKYQNCAFVRTEKSLVCWHNSVQEVTSYVRTLEKKMVDYVWEKGNAVDLNATEYVPRVTFTGALHKFPKSDSGSDDTTEEKLENIVFQKVISENSSETSKKPNLTKTSSRLSVATPTNKVSMDLSESNYTNKVSMDLSEGSINRREPLDLSELHEPTEEKEKIDASSNSSQNNENENHSTKSTQLTTKERISITEESIQDVSSNNEVELELQVSERPVMYTHATMSALSVALVLTWSGLQIAEVAKTIKAEKDYYILFSLLMVAPYFLFTSFFGSAVISVVFYILGPISQMERNSYSYSVNKVPRIKAVNGNLPHVTIQCPVYKEKLESVIKPTVKSLQAAIRTYELQGGSANVFINDDGLQLIDREEALERIEFYEECGLGYIARPAHGDNGFVRKGRFKKASNMNYCLNISKMVDVQFHERLAEIEHPTPKEESGLYLEVLEDVVKEEGKCWAGGDILLGELILIIDSDTRVPEDCFIDSVSEMYASPEVAIIQHASGVMMVVGNYWEKMIAWFTDLIYFSISCVSGNGLTMAAFVGHNAFLRWSAIQELAYVDEEDGRTKYWSESHVSEDFEMTLKLASLGYTIRIATYHDRGFMEGVSLTVYDEITRWSKYAFGCAEIMFTPFKKWWTGKIFSNLFILFLNSGIPLSCKFSILSYMGTYFAIASSLIMLIANYFIVGYYNWGYSRVYIDAMKVFVSVLVVFGCASQVAYIIGRYRIYKHSIWQMILEFRYSVLFCVFMGGLSWHMIVSIGSYFMSIDMQWGATAKDIDDSNFFKELPKATKNYRFMYIVCILIIGGMILGAYGVPYAYQIRLLVCALPLGWSVASHMLAPLVLNPQLMTFAW